MKAAIGLRLLSLNRGASTGVLSSSSLNLNDVGHYGEMALATQVVQRVLDSITESLSTHGGIELRGFGVFDVVMAKGRVGRNPRTGEKVVVAPKARVRFRMGKEMRERVKGLRRHGRTQQWPLRTIP